MISVLEHVGPTGSGDKTREAKRGFPDADGLQLQIEVDLRDSAALWQVRLVSGVSRGVRVGPDAESRDGMQCSPDDGGWESGLGSDGESSPMAVMAEAQQFSVAGPSRVMEIVGDDAGGSAAQGQAASQGAAAGRPPRHGARLNACARRQAKRAVSVKVLEKKARHKQQKAARSGDNGRRVSEEGTGQRTVPATARNAWDARGVMRSLNRRCRGTALGAERMGCDGRAKRVRWPCGVRECRCGTRTMAGLCAQTATRSSFN